MGTADQIFDEVLAVMGGEVTPAEQATVDYLTYRCYRYNRELGLSALDLAKLWPQTGEAMESKYQAEGNAYAERMIRADKEARHAGGPEHDRDTFGAKLTAGS